MSTDSTNPANTPLRGRDIWVVAVSSMEQIIGAGLSTVVGVMIPMIKLATDVAMPSWQQGLIGAIGLVGIGVGSAIIGKLSDKQGYLSWFRICPILIIIGSLMCLLDGMGWLYAGLMLCGIGVGGGYSLDSTYISELLPVRWRQMMIGIAKASSALGFLFVAVACYWVLRVNPDPELWKDLMLIVAALGALTLVMRLRWAESPQWLLAHGQTAKAQQALSELMGNEVSLESFEVPKQTAQPSSWWNMFRGENFNRMIYSGIPWACEGLGVYGIGVFLPILVMALGLESSSTEGMAKVVNSVEITAIVNFFILPGFLLGLWVVNRINHVKLLSWGFILSAVGLAILYVGFTLHLSSWVLILGFIIFEVFLNAGPHLITYIIPSQIYPINDRAAGSGIAALMGKVGAVVGVILMPILLELGGMKLVLIVSAIVMLLGALVAIVYGKLLKLV